MAGRRDDISVTDSTLLGRSHELSWRRLLSRLPEERRAQLTGGAAPEPPLTVDEQLELLQTRYWIERRMASSRPSDMCRAREAGASWEQIAEILEVDIVRARDEFAAWIDGQQKLHDSIGFGLDDDAAAAAWALLEQDAPADGRAGVR